MWFGSTIRRFALAGVLAALAAAPACTAAPTGSTAQPGSTVPRSAAPTTPAPTVPASTAAPAVSLPSIDPRLTVRVRCSEYEKLADGITYEAAQTVIGGPAMRETTGEAGGHRTLVAVYDGMGAATVALTFTDGVLTAKAQTGLC